MAATLAGTFAACEGNENNPEEKDKPEVVSPEINVASGQSLSLVISDEGGSETISFTTNKGWVATVAHPWLKLSQNQGAAGNATITVTASPNPDFEERSTTVTIKCETVTTAVKVTQKQKGALILSASSIPVSDEGETISITLKANSAVTANVTKGADWIIPLETKGLVETVLQFTVLANDETDAREGEITFTNEAGSETVKIVQAAKGAIVISPTEIPVGAEGEAISITVKSNTDYTVAVTKGDEWIIPLETKGLVETVRQFNILPNEGYDPREGEITFTCASGSQNVIIKQAAADEEPEEPEEPVNPYGDEDLPMLTEETVWAGEVFDAIIAKNAPDATEWISEDGVNFIESKLGFFAGSTTGVNADTGVETVTYGKFKFKKDEKAYNNGTKMSRVQMGGTGVLGKRNILQFKVNGPGALTIIGRSSGDAARAINFAVGSTPVSAEGYTLPGKASDSQKVSVEIQAAEGDIISVYSMESGINFYSLKWVPGGKAEGGNDEPEPEPAGDSDDLECPNPPTVGQVSIEDQIGYGASVSGGKGATANNILHFNNGKAFQTWLLARTKSEKAGDHSPVEIWLSGTFTPDQGRDFSEAHPWFDVKDVSNLSIYGTDGFVMDRIGIFCVRANNIIIRNINFRQPKANNGADAVSMQNCDGVWVDHCTFTSLNQTKDYEDGSCDITHASKNVTVSWCRFIKTQKSCLVGHSNSASADAAITVTFHHNWFDQSSSRHPRVRFGKAHVYNNLYDGCTTYGAGSAYGAKVLVEYNYFDAVQLQTDICTYPAKENGNSNLQGSVAGYLYATQNMYVNKPAKAKSPYPLTNVKYTAYNGSTITPLTYNDFKPTYSYTVNAAEDVPAVVKEGAGYGKLGYTSAPVAVNNGDITEFNGTDDNPEDPDPEDPDDPDTPVVSGPHVYTLSMQNKAPVQTLDGQSGASYFDASTSVADFSKDYSGSFTIDGTVFSQGFKFDSKGYAKFTTSSEYTTKVRFYFARRKNDNTGAKIMLVSDGGAEQTWDTPWDTFGDSGEVTLEKGMGYTVKQKSSEQALIYMVITESE